MSVCLSRWEQLPIDVQKYLFMNFVPYVRDRSRAQRVCKRWKSLVRSIPVSIRFERDGIPRWRPSYPLHLERISPAFPRLLELDLSQCQKSDELQDELYNLSALQHLESLVIPGGSSYMPLSIQIVTSLPCAANILSYREVYTRDVLYTSIGEVLQLQPLAALSSLTRLEVASASSPLLLSFLCSPTPPIPRLSHLALWCRCDTEEPFELSRLNSLQKLTRLEFCSPPYLYYVAKDLLSLERMKEIDALQSLSSLTLSIRLVPEALVALSSLTNLSVLKLFATMPGPDRYMTQFRSLTKLVLMRSTTNDGAFLRVTAQNLTRLEKLRLKTFPLVPLSASFLEAIGCFSYRVQVRLEWEHPISYGTGPVQVEKDLTDEATHHLARLRGISALRLSLSQSRKLTSATFESLAAMTWLEDLEICCSSTIPSASYAYLSSLRSLTRLDLHDTNIDEFAFGKLCQKRNSTLVWLLLSGTQIKTLNGIENLESLSFLSVANCVRLNDIGIRPLIALTALRQLDISGTAVCGTGLKNAKFATSLRELNFCRSHELTKFHVRANKKPQISVEGAKELAQFTNVKSLYASEPILPEVLAVLCSHVAYSSVSLYGVTPDHLPALAKCQSIEKMRLDSADIGDTEDKAKALLLKLIPGVKEIIFARL